MPFQLEALPAHKGDCLLLHFGADGDPKLIVIDGGPSATYRPHLRPRLLALRAERDLSDEQPLPIHLLMVSHIDDDHIKGVLELTAELRNQKESAQPLLYDIKRIWHNTFDDLLDTDPGDLQASITSKFGAASSADVVLAKSPNLSRDAAMVLVSVPQGRQLRDDIAFLKLRLNAPFQSFVKQDEADPAAQFMLEGHLTITTIGPMQAQLAALQAAHDKWLVDNDKASDSPEAALAAFSDRSVPNLSSIVIQVEQAGETMLLTGDARGDHILTGLREAGLLTDGGVYEVDVLKAPHHGSDNNVDDSFFEQVRATHYVFSGDGKHGNPERETFNMLFRSRRAAADAGAADKFFIHLTYELDEIDENRREEWEKQFTRGKKTRHWNDAKDSLSAFFASTEEEFDLLEGRDFELNAGTHPILVP